MKKKILLISLILPLLLLILASCSSSSYRYAIETARPYFHDFYSNEIEITVTHVRLRGYQESSSAIPNGEILIPLDLVIKITDRAENRLVYEQGKNAPSETGAIQDWAKLQEGYVLKGTSPPTLFEVYYTVFGKQKVLRASRISLSYGYVEIYGDWWDFTGDEGGVMWELHKVGGDYRKGKMYVLASKVVRLKD